MPNMGLLHCREECSRCEHYRKLDVLEPRCFDIEEGPVLVTGKCALQSAKGEQDATGFCVCPLHYMADLPL